MSPNLSKVDELLAAVEAEPGDPAARRSLVDALIDDGDFARAETHFEVLAILASGQPWLDEIERKLAEAEGNTLRAARARRRSSTNLSTNDENEEELTAIGHPSKDIPHLRLLAGGAAEAPAEQTTHLLSEVAGLATVKAYISQMLEEVHHTPDGMPGPWLGGALFYGPQGCGKAFCASVVAGELGADFVVIDLSESWSPRSLHVLVESILNGPTDRRTVLYLENLDEKFGPDHATAIEPTLGVLDAARERAKVVILGSATVPWLVSKRLACAGRLGRAVLVLPPDAPARHLFIERSVGDADLSATADDVDWLVHQTEGHSFYDLQLLLESAASSGGNELSHVALRTAVQQVPPSSSDWLTTAGHHALMNEAGGMYDDLLAYFQRRRRH